LATGDIRPREVEFFLILLTCAAGLYLPELQDVTNFQESTNNVHLQPIGRLPVSSQFYEKGKMVSHLLHPCSCQFLPDSPKPQNQTKKTPDLSDLQGHENTSSTTQLLTGRGRHSPTLMDVIAQATVLVLVSLQGEGVLFHYPSTLLPTICRLFLTMFLWKTSTLLKCLFTAKRNATSFDTRSL